MAAKRLAIAAGMAVLAFTTAIYAEDSGPRSDVRTDEVVVTASRFEELVRNQPIGTHVITGEQIRAAGVRSLPEFLSRTAGIYSRDNFGSPNQQIDMRGFGASGDQNTLILLDGQRISENELVPADLASVPLSSIERIEIIRGGGSVLYGGGASGGTINVITRGAQPDTRNASFKGRFGTYNTHEVSATAAIASERFGASFNVGEYASDNYRDNNDLTQRNFQSDFRFFGRDGPVYLKINTGDQDLRLPGPRNEAELESDRRGSGTPDDFSSLRTTRVNLGTTLMFDAVEAAVDLTYRERDSFAVNQPGSIDVEGSDTAFSPRLRFPFTFGVTHDLVTGIDMDKWEYATSSIFPPFPPSAIGSNQTNSAFYIKDTMVLSRATQASLGWRAHRTETTIEDFSGGGPAKEQKRDLEVWEVALRQQLTEGISVYAKTGTSFRIANVDENRFLAVPLEPQTSRDTEIGAYVGGGRGWIRVAAYQMDISNEIAFLPSDVLPPFGGNINLPPTVREGFELEAQWNADDWLILSGQYTYTVAKFSAGSFGGADVAGNNIPLVPRQRAAIAATVVPVPRLSITGTATYVGEQYYDNDQSNSFGRQMPDYTVTDLTASYDAGSWTLEAIVRNLFNELYYSYAIVTSAPTFSAYPSFERNFLLTAQYRF